MTLKRLTQFGMPLHGRPQQSATTVRLVPLTQGMSANRPYTNEPPASASSLVNFLPINGALIPRSRLSSIATIGRPNQIVGMIEGIHSGALDTSRLWMVATGSASTDNLLAMTVGGVVSQASFVSSGGIGTAPSWAIASARPSFAFYPSVFDSSNVLDDLLLIALPKPITSAETLLAAGLTLTGPIYSYLTNAPKARYVFSYDDFVVAWNVFDATGTAQQRRAQWCDRGNPGVWTGGNSGFEDLLSMKGYGTGGAVVDNRLILFSTDEIWVGVPASYPAQFQFAPLDTTIGCPAENSGTVQNTELGLIFLGSDNNLRLLPRGGGLSVIINPSIGVFLRERGPMVDGAWAWYDADRRLYHLMPFIGGGTAAGIIVNLNTGEWGQEYTQVGATAGCYARTATAEKMFAGDINGFVYSTDSRLRGDTLPPSTGISALTVTSQFRSEPLGMDLPDGRRQVLRTNWDYRATSSATATVNLSGDYGNTFPVAATPVTLSVASFGQSLTVDSIVDGPAPVVEWTSDTTGYELHRASVTMALRGRR
jgi:hypothetical protein